MDLQTISSTDNPELLYEDRLWLRQNQILQTGLHILVRRFSRNQHRSLEITSLTYTGSFLARGIIFTYVSNIPPFPIIPWVTVRILRLLLAFSYAVFGRPFVKRFALCYGTVVLSVCNVVVLCPNGWMDQDQYDTWYGGRARPRRHCVIDGNPSAPPRKGA